MISKKNLILPLIFPISITFYIILNWISNLQYIDSCLLTEGCSRFYNESMPGVILLIIIASWVLTMIIIIKSLEKGYSQDIYSCTCLLNSVILFIAFLLTWYETYDNIGYIFDNLISRADRTIYQSFFSSFNIFILIVLLFSINFFTLMLEDLPNEDNLIYNTKNITTNPFEEYKSSVFGIKKAKINQEIKLRAYEYAIKKIIEEHEKESIFKKLISASEDIVQEFMENKEATIEDPSQENKISQSDLSKFIGGSTTCIKKGSPNFSKVARSPHKYGYKFVVYHLKCKLKQFSELPYIGVARNFNKRLSWHIGDTVRGYINKQMTYIQQAIALAIVKEFPTIKQEIEKLEPGIIYNKFDMIDIQNFFNNKPSATLKVFYTFLKQKILEKHFTMEIWEYHKDRKSAFANEKFQTLNHIHYIGNKKVTGTIFPNGLNSKAGGSGGTIKGRTDIPILDYAALVSLGYKHEEIIQIINEVYEGDFPSSTVSNHISHEFGSYEELQKRLLKPVVEELIKDPEDFQLFAIANAVRLDAKTLGIKLADWFEGNKFFDLKALIKTGILDWDNISEYSAESAKILRGFSAEQWVLWLVDDKCTMDRLVKYVNISKGWLYSKKYVKKLSIRLYGEELESLNLLKKNLRKEMTQELLQQGWDPRDILEKKFNIQFSAPFKLRDFFNHLYKDDGLEFNDLLNTYSNDAAKYIEKYRYYSKDF